MKTATNQSNSHRCETLATGTSPEMAASSLLVSVLMPCLNEARTLAACIEQAHAGCQTALSRRDSFASSQQSIESVNQPVHEEAACASVGYEILIADNGSNDRSVEIAALHGARVVAVAEPGYGAALQGGILAARGKYVVMGDADCSYDFGEVPRFLEQLEAGHDLVMGNRFSGEIKAGAMPWHHRYIGNPLLSGLGRLLYGTCCRDWHCGLRGFDREQVMALGLRCTGMEFASEMLVAAAKMRLSLSEIPVTLSPDGRDRPPHLRSFRDGWRHLRMMLGHRFAITPSKQTTT
jgi:glycosyltransferase involved in cell wall biosynthesis